MPAQLSTRTESRQSRLFGIDALKGLAIICVVGLHTLPIYSRRLNHPGSFGINLLGLAVPVFMITAVLFAAREFPRRGWAAIQRRLVRLIGVYAFWTGAYVVWLSVLRSGYWASVTTGTLTTLQTFLLGGAWYHLYFLPALIQLLVALPAIALLVRRPSWAWVAFAATTAALALGDFAGPDSPLIGWLHHQWVLVWLPEGIAGAALAARTIRCRRPWLWVGGGLAILLVESQLALAHNTPQVTAYARAGLPIAAVGLVGLAERVKAAPALLVRLGRQSLGVYLVHIAALYYVVKTISASHASLVEQGAFALITVAVSWAVIEVIDRTPACVVFGRAWRRGRRTGSGPDEIRLTQISSAERGLSGTGVK